MQCWDLETNKILDSYGDPSFKDYVTAVDYNDELDQVAVGNSVVC